MPDKAPIRGAISGVASTLKSILPGAKKELTSPKGKPDPQTVDPGWPEGATKIDKILYMTNRYYREGMFEKIPLSRKWMRNILMFQGYQDLEWNNGTISWDAIISQPDEYAYPNNQFRAHIIKGIALYLKTEPNYIFGPTSEDFDAQSVASAFKKALEVIKENIQYDTMRVWEALYLRLMGNSFRYSYYSLDPRYGYVTVPQLEEVPVQVDDGYYSCGFCGQNGYGNPQACENCGHTDQLQLTPPTSVPVQVNKGNKKYPRGQEQAEAVSPLEMYMRSKSANYHQSPYLIRARNVDRLTLQAAFKDIPLIGGHGTGGASPNTYGLVSGDGANSGEDLALMYQDSLADLPGDPTQFAAWYETSMKHSRMTFIQAWLRPALYWHDDELAKDFPDGIKTECANQKVLRAVNESIEDHWIHLPYNIVPGRVWADGDDDMVPKQLQLNETERLIVRNQAFNSVPRTLIDSQRIDKNKILNDPEDVIEVKQSGGRPISEAYGVIKSAELGDETWKWRAQVREDMDYLSGVFGSAIGEHQPGVDTLGGQQMFADRATGVLQPLLLIYKEGNELWARQMAMIAAQNWLDDRVHSVEGLNGKWEFSKLRAAALDPDSVKIVCEMIPVDYAEQQSFSQAVASGVLSPEDPRVVKKALQLYGLDPELQPIAPQQKRQWKEIEQMKETQKPAQVMPFVDNDNVHIQVCQLWLMSDEADDAMPQIKMAVYQHLQMHMQSQMKTAQAAAAIQAAPGEVHGKIGTQPQEQGQPAKPPSPQAKHQRAMKGAQAKPNMPQPSSGNQYGRTQ